ncbi:MAG: hypothetical protein HRU19_03615 [Pseudobacteriovorax sp.]|nr:hypothetical protein [Pseudobacteriovorax sp.]
MNKCKIEWLSESKVKISGVIDEFSTFESLFSKNLPEVWIDFSDVTRINSSGIREWVQAVLSTETVLHLENCSSVMVDQFSMIPEFVGKNGRVESFYCHYICDDCSHEDKDLLTVGKTIEPNQDFEPFLEKPCSNCGGTMELDHNPDIYFAFLRFTKVKAS